MTTTVDRLKVLRYAGYGWAADELDRLRKENAKLTRPADHDRRMAAARRRAHWELGASYWAAIIVDAYWEPDASDEQLRAINDEAR